MWKPTQKTEKALILLKDLLVILTVDNERNWSRGVTAAIHELLDANGNSREAGFDNARSIYNTMVAGGRGFSEYFIWVNDEDVRIRVNIRLDDLRSKLWKVFNP